jgi:hypothetical protein
MNKRNPSYEGSHRTWEIGSRTRTGFNDRLGTLGKQGDTTDFIGPVSHGFAPSLSSPPTSARVQPGHLACSPLFIPLLSKSEHFLMHVALLLRSNPIPCMTNTMLQKRRGRVVIPIRSHNMSVVYTLAGSLPEETQLQLKYYIWRNSRARYVAAWEAKKIVREAIEGR